MKKDIKLTRIHCAGCAVNLEDKIREISGVKSVNIDFVRKIVHLDVEHKNYEQIIELVKTCITKFDSSIKIVDSSEEDIIEKKEKIKKIIDVSRMFLAVVLTLFSVFLFKDIEWLSILFYCLAYIAVGYEVIFSALVNIIKGKVFDENFLMLIATVGALILGEYIEAVAVMLLYTVGEFLQKLAVDKSRNRIKSLMTIKADNANLVKDNDEIIVPIDVLKVDDIIRVKPGEKVPVDCVVLEGKSSLNTSAITGESKELFVSQNSEILSGCINIDGVLLCKVTKTEKESAVSKIIELVERASNTKAKTEKFITRFAKWYTPIVVFIALFLAVIPGVCGFGFETWIYRALVFLVVSCPCALVISIPLGYFAGIGASARKGVLVKGATYIDLLANTDTVIFDKTGTLTYGDFEVVSVYAEDDSSEEEVLELIAYGESFSNHRIAKSIVKSYSKNINTAWVSDYQELAGLGVKVNLFNEDCLIGNAELLEKNGVDFERAKEVGTIVYLAKSGEFLGYIVVQDKIKEDSYTISEKLKTLGVKNVSMFTGDNREIAKDVSDKLKLDSCYAELLPSDKVEMLKRYENNKLVFVGDGINDAPVLSTVDVGVSMGGVGSDIAIEASDVVLMTNEPSKLVDAIKVSKKTKNIIVQNIVFIMMVKLAVMILSVLGISGMWLAIFADVGVCLLCILNSLRIMITKKTKGEMYENNLHSSRE